MIGSCTVSWNPRPDNSRLPDRADNSGRPCLIRSDVRGELVLEPLDRLEDSLVLALGAAIAFLADEPERRQGRRVRRISRRRTQLDTRDGAILGQLLEESLKAGVGSLKLLQALRDLAAPQLGTSVRRVRSWRPRPRSIGSGDEVAARSSTSTTTTSVDVSDVPWSCAIETHGGSLAPIHFILRERHRAAALSVSWSLGRTWIRYALQACDVRPELSLRFLPDALLVPEVSLCGESGSWSWSCSEGDAGGGVLGDGSGMAYRSRLMLRDN